MWVPVGLLVCLQEAQITERELLGGVQRQRTLVWPAEGCVAAESFCGSVGRQQLTGSGARLGFVPWPPQGDRETGKVIMQGLKGCDAAGSQGQGKSDCNYY